MDATKTKNPKKAGRPKIPPAERRSVNVSFKLRRRDAARFKAQAAAIRDLLEALPTP